MNAPDVSARVSRNAAVQLAARLLYLLTRIGLPPLILAHVTLAEYGLWTVCFIVIGYLGMSAFGVSNVYIRYVADYSARQDTQAIERLVFTGISATTLLALPLLGGLWLGLDGLVNLFNVPAELHATARTLIFGTAAVMLLDLTLGASAYVLHGLHRMAEQTLVWVASYCLEAVLIVVLLLMGYGVAGLLWAFVIRYVFATAGHLWLCRCYLPGLRLSATLWDRRVLPLFFRYGGVVQLSGILSMILYSIEKVIAGITLGVAATGLFDVAQKLPVMASQVTGSVSGAFLPAVAHHHSLGSTAAIQTLYLNGVRTVALLTGVAMGFLAAFAAPLLAAWIGVDPAYAQAPLLLALFTLPYHAHVSTGPASMYYRGVGEPARELWYPLTQAGLVALGVLVVWIGPGFSVLSIAVLVALGMTGSALFYIIKTQRRLGLPLKALLTRALLPGLLPYAVGGGLALAWQGPLVWAGDSRWALLGVLAGAGISYLLLLLPLLYGLAEPQERARVQGLRAKLLRSGA